MPTQNKSIDNRIGWGRWLAITFIVGVAAFLASPNAPLGGFWEMQTGMHAPEGVQKGLFMLLAAIQSFAFGFGCAFLLFGWEAVRSFLRTSGGLDLGVYLAIAWSLLSWWPHSNLHQTHNPDNIGGLLAIEYGFHVTLIFGAVVIAYVVLMRSRQGQS